MPRLSQPFFLRDTRTVARDLLGRTVVHVIDGQRLAGRIVETEAYLGVDDQASHAHRGQTPRNAAMFGPVGISYIYLIYGRYWLLNVVAGSPDTETPAAVLIRALQPLEGLQHMSKRRAGRKKREWTSGPGRLTMALGIDDALDGIDMTAPGSPLYFEPGDPASPDEIQSGPRIGINVDEPWQSIEWRFWIEGNPYVSR